MYHAEVLIFNGGWLVSRHVDYDRLNGLHFVTGILVFCELQCWIQLERLELLMNGYSVLMIEIV